MVTRTRVMTPFARTTDLARLVVVDGPDRGSAQLIGADRVTVGSTGVFALTDAAVSRQHAQVRWHNGMLEVVDLASKNGTFVGACRIHRAEVPPGTTIRIGASLLKALLDDEPVEPIASTSTRSGALVAQSRVMRQLFTLIEQVARGEASVLVEGERGVGKTLVAEEIHLRSPRREHPLITLECRDELDHAMVLGVLAEADGGTLVLEDVGELPLELQAALLDRRLRGARVIATTREPLEARIADGLFRDDVFYRIAAVRVSIPPLRERPEDIAVIVEQFARGKSVQVPQHDWPGNVRELLDVLGGRAVASASAAQPSFRDGKAAAIEGFERRYLEQLVARYPTLAAAAEAARMDRKHLRVLLRRYGLRDG